MAEETNQQTTQAPVAEAPALVAYKAEVLPPAEGNNIGSVQDRAFADMPHASGQPPVEKTFVGS